jgi:integration host factor subunit alpha
MSALTKAELVQSLFDRIGLNKQEAKKLVDQLFEVIRASLENGEEVKLSGFGNFSLNDKHERPGRNPKTGEVVMVTPRRVVKFKASQVLKSNVSASLIKDK